MKEPTLRDFGITDEEYERFKIGRVPWTRGVSAAVIVLISLLIALIYLFAYLVTHDLGNVIWMFILTWWIGGSIVYAATEEISKNLHPITRKIKLYRAALLTYQRTLETHWKSLSGDQFESELGRLFSHTGYTVSYVGGSGDEGADLILRKDGETVIVQCKAHIAPVGPATVRELYGSMIHHNAHKAILASTGGFTTGVRRFVIGKPIELFSLTEIIKLQKANQSGTIRGRRSC